jgi:hypothetical protein
MFVINFNDKTVAEFNEQELSRLLNRFFGKPSTRQWLFAHDKKTATKIIKFAMKKKNVKKETCK